MGAPVGGWITVGTNPLSDENPKTAVGALKPDLSLIPATALIQEALAMGDGASRYGPYNWREKNVSARTYVAATMRHCLQYLDREDFDPVSNVHHLAHARACLGILLDAIALGNVNDNRPKKGTAGEDIRRLTKKNETDKSGGADHGSA